MSLCKRFLFNEKNKVFTKFSDLVDGSDTFADWCNNSGDDICVCDEPCKGNEDEFCGGSENFPIQTLTLTVEPAVVKLA